MRSSLPALQSGGGVAAPAAAGGGGGGGGSYSRTGGARARVLSSLSLVEPLPPGCRSSRPASAASGAGRAGSGPRDREEARQPRARDSHSERRA
eukprot:CAMPEP_0202770506 /NCGR_PEP_ID=MMETSP1388-20130828/38963_1 /ASSEMBLY_ACC=CAM_ASM_000864 /TAXON_ID=37098 /ORGANISM="Isochrysis sp, Strain CCMP1244" /LENGTH=93 /DNA_ID=CAMNT_0049439347 /DNA_START=13 /DNA_END=292 /DNA_ORIENTATION=-